MEFKGAFYQYVTRYDRVFNMGLRFGNTWCMTIFNDKWDKFKLLDDVGLIKIKSVREVKKFGLFVWKRDVKFTATQESMPQVAAVMDWKLLK